MVHSPRNYGAIQWCGTVWYGVVWYDSGMVMSMNGPQPSELRCYTMVWYCMVWCGMVISMNSSQPSDLRCCTMVWYGMVHSSMVMSINGPQPSEMCYWNMVSSWTPKQHWFNINEVSIFYLKHEYEKFLTGVYKIGKHT